MNHEQHQASLRDLQRRNRQQSFVIGGVILIALGCLGVIFSILGSERTVLVPPAIDRTFWVSRDKVSREYLEQMAGFIAWLELDLHPKNVGWKTSLLLTYVEPAEYPETKRRMDLEADRLRRINADTSFLVEQLVADEDSQTVRLFGLERLRINGQGEPKPKAYCARFRLIGGRVHLKAFKEIPYGQGTRGGAPAADDRACAA